MSTKMTPHQLEELIYELNMIHDDTEEFEEYYEENCDTGEITDMIFDMFDLHDYDPEELDVSGAFIDLVYNLDYRERDYQILKFCGKDKEATYLLELFLEENKEELAESIKEYLEECE